MKGYNKIDLFPQEKKTKNRSLSQRINKATVIAQKGAVLFSKEKTPLKLKDMLSKEEF